MVTAVVVDDDKDTVDVFCDYLKVKKVEVVGKGYNGKDALEMYQLYRPDVIFLDLMMPDYDGFYALEKIRKIDPSAKIVVITADLRPDTAQRLEQLNPTEVFIKPYDIENITTMLDKI